MDKTLEETLGGSIYKVFLFVLVPPTLYCYNIATEDRSIPLDSTIALILLYVCLLVVVFSDFGKLQETLGGSIYEALLLVLVPPTLLHCNIATEYLSIPPDSTITLILLYVCLLVVVFWDFGKLQVKKVGRCVQLHVVIGRKSRELPSGPEIPLERSSTKVDSVQEYRAVTRKLKNFIYRICQQNKIDSIVISQSTADWRNILVIGHRVASIGQKLSKQISRHKEFEHFVVETEDQENPITNIQYGGNHSKLTVNKYKTTGDNWNNEDSLTSELIVSAVDKSPNSNGRQATYLAVAAHLLLTEEERESGASADNIWQNRDEDTQLISQIRAKVESRSSKTKYCVSIGGESAFLDTQHPVLFCYRHWYHHLRNSGNSDWWETSCPHEKCPSGSNSLCPHLMMNDVALLRISPDEAAALNRKFNSASVRVANQVQLFSCPDDVEELHIRSSIIVKGLEGITCETPDQRNPGQTLGQHIRFTLTCDSQLQPGDCGSIVYLKHDNGSLTPLGLFVGEWRLNTTRTGHGGPFYQAIILSQAFKDLETDYPHLLENIRPFPAV